MSKIILTERQIELIKFLEECDGAEIHQEDWEEYRELQKLGLVTLTCARGPGREWKRAELVMVPIYHDFIK